MFLLLTGLLSLRSALFLPAPAAVTVVDRGPGRAGALSFLSPSARAAPAPPPTPQAQPQSPAPQPAAAWPAVGRVTGVFNEPRPGHAHTGIDIDGETGDPVHAAFAGTVLFGGRAPRGFSGYGTIVVIGHANGLTTLYAHLSRVSVATGRQVAPGDVVGAMGCTGSCTGSHLHFEVRFGSVPVDPRRYLPA